MINAAEARKISAGNNIEIKQQFKDVDKYITEATMDGLYSVQISGILHEYVKKYLISLGYCIDEFYNCDTPFYSIHWVR